MTISINRILAVLGNLVESDIVKSSNFGLDFCPLSEKVLETNLVKGIVLTPFITLSLFPFMREHNLNLIISIERTSSLFNTRPLSEYNYEIIKALVSDNYKTIALGEKWIFSKNGAFNLFLQSLGMKNIRAEVLILPSRTEVCVWNIEKIMLNDFLQLISHHTKNWICVSRSNKVITPLVFNYNSNLTIEDINYLSKEGINTLISFILDTKKLASFRHSPINYVVLPYIPFINLALKKLAQLLEMELEIKVLPFHPIDQNYVYYHSVTEP